jgi:glycosyltransferase involved in cell wall biosynthesis
MPTWPEVTIVVCTYDRPDEIRWVLRSLYKHLQYDFTKVHLHIADDGTEKGYISGILKYCSQLVYYEHLRNEPTFTVTDRQGWGANVNKALQAVTTDYVYFTEDDYVLLRDLDLYACVAAMEEAKTLFGLMRFGIAGHVHMIAELLEVDIHAWRPYYQENGGGQGSSGMGTMQLWNITKHTEFYPYSNRPHLVHRRFHDTYGYYAEGLPLAQTEHDMCQKFITGPVQPYIVCPATWVNWYYSHVGKSRQNTPADKESSNAS